MTQINATNDSLIVYDASAQDLGQVTVSQLMQAGLRAGSTSVTLSVAADGKLQIDIDSSQFMKAILSLPLADGMDSSLDFAVIYDASLGTEARLPLSNLIAAGNLTGTYTPATLPASATTPVGVSAYCTGITTGGNTVGFVYNDGTNWRKAANNQLVI